MTVEVVGLLWGCTYTITGRWVHSVCVCCVCVVCVLCVSVCVCVRVCVCVVCLHVLKWVQPTSNKCFLVQITTLSIDLKTYNI